MPLLSNTRHEKFAQGIASGLSQAAAYAQAGYQGSVGALRANAARLIARDSVASRIDELNAPAMALLAQHAEAAVASAEWIVAGAVEVFERAMTPVPVYYQGQPTTELQWFGNTAVAALALLAKRHPEFRDAAPVDQSQHIHFPPGTTLAEIRSLRDGLRQ